MTESIESINRNTKFWKKLHRNLSYYWPNNYFLFFNKIYVIKNTSLIVNTSNTFLMIVYKKIRIILLFVNVFILSNTTVQSCFSFAEHRLFMTMRCQNHFQTTTKKNSKNFRCSMQNNLLLYWFSFADIRERKLVDFIMYFKMISV